MFDLTSRTGMPTLPQQTLERLWLVPARETADLTAVALPQGTTEIGSSPACDVCLSISGVDPQHCTIQVEGKRATITAHSRMTWINDGPITRSVIKPGQRLAVGPIEFRLEQRTEHVLAPLAPADFAAQLASRESPSSVESRIAQALTTLQQGVDALQSHPIPPSRSIDIQRPVRHDAAHATETDGINGAVRDLERRRALLMELQDALSEQTSAELRSFQSRAARQRQERDELSRLLNEQSIERMALLQEKQSLVERQHAMERRLEHLQQAEQELSIHRSEIEQVSSGIEELRRDQYQREQLLQARIEEINVLDAELVEREAEALRQRNDIDQRQADLDTRGAELEADREEWLRTRETTDASLQQLRETLDGRERELDQLRLSFEADRDHLRLTETELTHRQQQLDHQQQHLAAREQQHQALASELEAREAQHQANASELDARSETLHEQTQALKIRQSELDAAIADQEALQHSSQEEREELECSLREIEVAKQDLHDDRLQLLADRRELDAEKSQFEKARTQLGIERQELESTQAALSIQQQQLEQDRASLVEQQQELHMQQAAVTARQAELAETEERLSAQRAQIDQERKQLMEDHRRIESEQTAIREERNAFEQERATLLDKQSLLALQSQDDTADATQLQDELQRLAEEQSRLESERVQLESDRRVIASAQETLNAQSEALEHDRTQLAAERAQFEAAEQTLKDQRDAFEEEQSRLSTQRQELEQRGTDDDQQLADLRAEQDELRQLSLDIELQTQTLNARENRLAELEQQLQQRESELDIRSRSTDVSLNTVDDTDLNAEREDLEELRQSLSSAKAQLEDERRAFDEQQAKLAEDRSEVDAAHAEIQRQIGVLESARDELISERDRLESDIASFNRERQSLDDGNGKPSMNREIEPSEVLDVATQDDAHDMPGHYTAIDEYEMTDDEDECDRGLSEELIDEEHEVEPPADETAAALRSQLAALFGMSPAATGSQPARTRESAKPDVPDSPHEEQVRDRREPEVINAPLDLVTRPAPAPAPRAIESHSNTSEDPNSISAYMESLLARNPARNGAVPYHPPAAPPKPPAPAPREASTESAFRVSEPTAKEPISIVQPSRDRKERDADTERAHIDSLRELANHSARSAVAVHNSAGLKNHFLIKGIVTAGLFIATVVLLTAHFWVGVSYVSWGFIAAAAMCVSAFEFLKTFSQLEANKVYQFTEEPESEDAVLKFVEKLAMVARGLTFGDRSTPETIPAESADSVDDELFSDESAALQSLTDPGASECHGIDAEEIAEELTRASARDTELTEEFVPMSIRHLMNDESNGPLR